MADNRDRVFISYSHANMKYLDEFRTQLSPLKDKIDVWSDKDIKPGEDWHQSIQEAIDSACIAVLLVTPAFLASDYIAENELPKIFKNSGKGIHVFWIPIAHSNYRWTAIGQYQAASDPEIPLNAMRPAKRQKAWVTICEKLLQVFEICTDATSTPQADDSPSHDFPFVIREEDKTIQVLVEDKAVELKWSLAEPGKGNNASKDAWMKYEKLEARIYPRVRDAHMALLSFLTLFAGKPKNYRRDQHLAHAGSVLKLLENKSAFFNDYVDELMNTHPKNETTLKQLRQITYLLHLAMKRIKYVQTSLLNSADDDVVMHHVTQTALLLERICHWLLQSHRFAKVILD